MSGGISRRAAWKASCIAARGQRDVLRTELERTRGDLAVAIREAADARALVKPGRIIRTYDELLALPDWTVVVNEAGAVLLVHDHLARVLHQGSGDKWGSANETRKPWLVVHDPTLSDGQSYYPPAVTW